jgi:hypothetical protein
MTGINIVHVPYRGSAAAYPDLITSKVQVLFDNLPGSIEFVRTGQLRALGVTTATRSDALPDVPAIGETVPSYEASVWYRIAAPKGTLAEAIEVLNKAVAAALADPKMQARLAELGGVPMPMSPAEFGKLLADETEKWVRSSRPRARRWSERDCGPHSGEDHKARSLRLRYFFICFLRKSMVRCQASLALASWKLPRSSQWKPCCASG